VPRIIAYSHRPLTHTVVCSHPPQWGSPCGLSLQLLKDERESIGRHFQFLKARPPPCPLPRCPAVFNGMRVRMMTIKRIGCHKQRCQ
jgi:hypothetical protein